MAIEISARRGIRTPDLLITKQLLYQLSYTGKREQKHGEHQNAQANPERELV